MPQNYKGSVIKKSVKINENNGMAYVGRKFSGTDFEAKVIITKTGENNE